MTTTRKDGAKEIRCLQAETRQQEASIRQRSLQPFRCKAGGPPFTEKLTELFHIMWRKEAIPQEFKDASIIHLFKRKGNPQVCNNHRGISLLSIAGKVLARVLLNRLNEQLGLLPESQCGFRKNRETIDMIFTAR